MEMTSGHEQWTHEEVVTAAREGLLSELDLEETEFGRTFLGSPIGPRVRVGGVRASLARFTAEHAQLRYGNYLDATDEVVLHFPTNLDVREGLQIPVLSSVSIKLRPFV